MRGAIIWVVAIVIVAILSRGRRRWRGHVGSAAIGATYGMLNEDKQKAVEMIVEQHAGERDPEDRDGNLPDLAKFNKSN